MLGEKFKTFGVSFAIHALVAVLLTTLAADTIVPDEPESIEIEILAAPEPESEPLPEPPPEPEPAPIPTVQRPVEVPRRVVVQKVEEARPFQENAVTEDGPREAPPDTEAVPLPTAPVVDMESTVGSGNVDYVTTSAGAGAVPVREGPGGGVGGDGPGRGAPGALGNQDAADVAVARDWQITRMPEPLNDGDFEPRYPPLARREGREAAIVLRLFIDLEGRVSRVVRVDGPRDGGFFESARDYAYKLRFNPARAGERKVASRVDWTVYFYVRN